MLSKLTQRLKQIAAARRQDEDFMEEVASHIALEADRLQKEHGLSEVEAYAAARRAFGNPTKATERFHNSGRWLWLDHMVQDLRLVFRQLSKTPAWTATAILTAALGLGAAIAMFSVVNAALLSPLPYPDSDQIYWMELDPSTLSANRTVQAEMRSGQTAHARCSVDHMARELPRGEWHRAALCPWRVRILF